MNLGKVVIATDQLGSIIGISTKSPEYGYIRVEQATSQISDGGWLKVGKRSTLIKGKVDELRSMNYKEGDILSGKIIIKESFEPFNKVNPDKDLKIAGSTGVVCRVGERAIYRSSFYTTDLNAEDELIIHDNTLEIQDAQMKQKLSALKPSNKFEAQL